VLGRLEPLVGAGLRGLYPAIMSCALLLIAPIMSGAIIGFLLLDQRDDRTLIALQVTPLPLDVYLAYRLAAPILVSLIMTLVAFPIAGLAGMGMLRVALAAMAAAPLAPLTALALAVFAENKVQGLALMKAANILLIAPLAASFISPPWQWAFAIAPTFWPARLLLALQGGEPHAWLLLAGGLAYQGVLLMALLRRFRRVMYQ
jgi:fluoroquinolone transport system permease protein